jgi:uncharacterized protein HemY
MIYIIALFIPPLGVLFAGRVIATVVLLVVWVVLVAFLAIIGHIIAVVVAWVIIASAKGDRRHKELLNGPKMQGEYELHKARLKAEKNRENNPSDNQ